MRMWRAKPACASRFTWSSTAWMLRLSRGAGRCVGEGLHPVDEFDDAVGLLADQPRQRAILVADRALQQLRRAANAGERVLDLMREHGAERGHRAGGAAMGELSVHFFGN